MNFLDQAVAEKHYQAEERLPASGLEIRVRIVVEGEKKEENEKKKKKGTKSNLFASLSPFAMLECVAPRSKSSRNFSGNRRLWFPFTR